MFLPNVGTYLQIHTTQETNFDISTAVGTSNVFLGNFYILLWVDEKLTVTTIKTYVSYIDQFKLETDMNEQCFFFIYLGWKGLVNEYSRLPLKNVSVNE